MQLLVCGAKTKHDTGSVRFVVYLDLPVVVVSVPCQRLGAPDGGRALAAFWMEADLELVGAHNALEGEWIGEKGGQ